MQGKLTKNNQIKKALLLKDVWLNMFLNIYCIQKQYTMENIYENVKSAWT